MKKIATLCMVILASFLLIACKDSANDKIKEVLDDLKIVSTTTEDIILKTSSDKYEDIVIFWESSKPNVISTTGKVSRQKEDTEVVLTATAKIGEKSDKKEFEVKVLKLVELLSPEIKEVLESITLPSTTDKDLTLVSESMKHKAAVITWKSSKPTVISMLGKVNRQTEDTKVILTVTVKLDGMMSEKEFEVTVSKTTGIPTPETLDLNSFYNSYGFASLSISNRENKTVIEVSNEIEFLEALLDTNNKVIKITEDLNMGYHNVVKKLTENNASADKIKELTENSKLYRQNSNIPLLHPTLIKEGVGQLIIDGREDLMIYSEKGITIRHLTTHVKGNTKDLVIRNIRFADIWEWDEKDRGQFKLNDWDFFTLESVDGVWFDHLSFTNAYDGIIDAKGNVENVTLSYLDLNFVTNDFIKVQMDWLEENRTSDDAKYYNELRQKASKEDITTVAASQKKGFNFGNTTDGVGFENITITMHNIYARNLQDRFPRLRKGDVHLYNVVSDATDISNLRGIGIPVVNQAIVPTERGAVLMENSIFKNIAEAIKTHQDSNLDSRYTGRYSIKNSQYIYDNESYFGSSTHLSLWNQSNTNADVLPFYFRNYQDLPYTYHMVDAKDLESRFLQYTPGTFSSEQMNWLKIDSDLSENKTDRGQMILEDLVTGLESALVKKGGVYTPNFEVYNFYGNAKLILNEDYTFVAKNQIDTNVAGIYTVTYEITSKKGNKNIIEVTQEVVVYDENKENEIYQKEITDEQNKTVDAKLNVYAPHGTLYYLVSNEKTMTKESLMGHANVITYKIETTEINLSSIDTSNGTYIHFITKRDDLVSKLVTQKIQKETIIEINNTDEFNSMLKDTNTKGKYFILTKDIDFEGAKLDTNKEFMGVLDGNGFVVKNIKEQDARRGIFGLINGGIIKNITFDSIDLTSSGSDRNGLLSGTISGRTMIVNVKFNDIKVVSGKNKLGVITGEVLLGGDLTLSQITLTNIYLKSNKLTSILIGEIAADTNILVTDIYMNHTKIDTPKKEGASGIVANTVAGAKLVVENVYARDFKVDASHNIGFVVGKLAADSSLDLDSVFVEYTEFKTVKANNNTIVGNKDGDAILSDAIFTLGINKADGAKGLAAKVVLEETTVIDKTWIEINMPEIDQSNLWEFKDNQLVLK